MRATALWCKLYSILINPQVYFIIKNRIKLIWIVRLLIEIIDNYIFFNPLIRSHNNKHYLYSKYIIILIKMAINKKIIKK